MILMLSTVGGRFCSLAGIRLRMYQQVIHMETALPSRDYLSETTVPNNIFCKCAGENAAKVVDRIVCNAKTSVARRKAQREGWWVYRCCCFGEGWKTMRLNHR